MSTEDTMEPKTNGIDDFPEHWKATLLGEDFWKDAENWNKDTDAKIEAGKYPLDSLHQHYQPSRV
jgi:hypothetical protein